MNGTESQKIAVFGMMNNPVYRQEPWRESVAQRLECFDAVCFVCGNEPDVAMLAEAFPNEWQSGKLKAIYKQWPFPEWSYEELPKHLNAALALARAQGCEWMMKLDIDTVVHEKDMKKLRRATAKAARKNKWVVSVPKLQFFSPERYFKKANLPIVIRSDAQIAYGFDETRYTDLCQPILWDGVSTVVHEGKAYDIPTGQSVPKKDIFISRRAKVFNYDFTFRTFERSVELLYQIEMAHARFWGRGYTGLPLEGITRETSMRDFLLLSRERLSRMRKRMKINAHPKHFQDALRHLASGQWGRDMWGKF